MRSEVPEEWLTAKGLLGRIKSVKHLFRCDFAAKRRLWRINMQQCLNQELIESYVTGGCSADKVELIEAHLADCSTCREQVETARANQNFLDEMKGFIADSDWAGSSSREAGAGDSLSSRPDSDADVEFSASEFTVSRIKGYRIEEVLGRGGQAVVYKAYQEATKRVVALKVLLHGPFASEKQQQRFEREIDVAANLRHPNIVTIFDSGVTQGQYYFAMEYVQGQRLDDYVRRHSLSVRKILELAAKVCGAVAHAHQNGVIHRI